MADERRAREWVRPLSEGPRAPLTMPQRGNNTVHRDEPHLSYPDKTLSVVHPSAPNCFQLTLGVVNNLLTALPCPQLQLDGDMSTESAAKLFAQVAA